MARSKSSKEEILKRLEDAIDGSISIVFASVKGLRVHDIEDLRNILRSEQSECMVAKKTLLSRAFSNKGLDVDFKEMEGEIAAIFGYADQVAPARILSTFGKTHDHLAIGSGLLRDESQIFIALVSSAVKALALLPSRDELRARVAGSLVAPLRNCVGVLVAPLRSFVQVLNAVAETKS